MLQQIQIRGDLISFSFLLNHIDTEKVLVPEIQALMGIIITVEE